MPTETWSGYPPEMNSGRWEAGTGPASWEAAALLWTDFAAIVMAAATELVTTIGMLTGVTITGLSSVAMMSSSVPFFGWLATMEAHALLQAAACQTVALAWATATTGIIPLPVVTQNRITEAHAEATNFFGVNTPLIGELNREYAQFWTQDGAYMMTYDEAVSLATKPKMAPPPPPLSSAAKAAGDAAQGLAEVGANTAQNASKLGDTASQFSDAASQTGSSASDPMSSMMGMASQTGGQMGGQFQSLTQPLQSLTQPLQSMLGQFSGGPQFGQGLDGAFSPSSLGAATGGLPLSSGMSGGGAGMGGGGGGMGGAMGGGGAMGSMNGSGSKLSSSSTLSGVPGPSMGAGSKMGGNGMMGGGGMGGAGAGGAGGQGSSKKAETILAANVEELYGRTDRRSEARMFS